ncbi:hypothetical protein [Xenorhabdus sp. KK7.4]|uniref:hypothetical protein n=1 Tax=Xenorhabdus sp. KK7.4 TaxID=1851572 RepID=UPI000C03D40B|nr:hypothetical protein [Xenorhabdus sp. KK7.4]PHM51414.1 hypothetical protein Xekk_03722 [Xenorhabdus sp. KK7.4]
MGKLKNKELNKNTIPDAFWDDINNACAGVKDILENIFLAVEASGKLSHDIVEEINYAVEEIYKTASEIIKHQKEKGIN